MSIKNGFNSDQDWEKINEEWQRSGLLMSEYCRANNINKQNLYEWRYKNKKSNLTKKPGAVASREKKNIARLKINLSRSRNFWSFILQLMRRSQAKRFIALVT